MTTFFYLLCAFITPHGELDFAAFYPSLSEIRSKAFVGAGCASALSGGCMVEPVGKEGIPYWASPVDWEHFARLECTEFNGITTYTLRKVAGEK